VGGGSDKRVRDDTLVSPVTGQRGSESSPVTGRITATVIGGGGAIGIKK